MKGLLTTIILIFLIAVFVYVFNQGYITTIASWKLLMLFVIIFFAGRYSTKDLDDEES